MADDFDAGALVSVRGRPVPPPVLSVNLESMTSLSESLLDTDDDESSKPIATFVG